MRFSAGRPLLRRAPIRRAFYERPTEEVARDLLGKILLRSDGEGTVAVRLTEVEAYLGIDDPACHTFRGRRTARNEVMWGCAGHLYVYFTYGMHFCANIVTRGAGVPEAVLLRGGDVIEGEALAVARRGGKRRGLLDGPAKLCQGLALTREQNGVDVASRVDGIWIVDGDPLAPGESIETGPRVGVDYAGEAAGWPLRFRLSGRVRD